MPLFGQFDRKVCVQVGVVGVIVLMALVCVVQLLSMSSGDLDTEMAHETRMRRQVKIDYPSLSLPTYIRDMAPLPDVRNISMQIKVKTGFRTFDTKSGKQHWVYVRETVPLEYDNETDSKQDILLFHGARFSSKTWEDLGTMNLLSALGYRVVAVDIPGFGRSPRVEVTDRVEFVRDLIPEFGLNWPVLVTPSMSGSYALPFVFRAEPPHITALVTLAPVFTAEFSRQQYKNFMIPTLAIYGENDLDIGLSGITELSYMGNKYAYMIPDAGHAFYISKTRMFHQILYNFLEALPSNYI
ncbi:protein ABHD14A-like [Liolophura sinensis]|uniref:protein ABHD14A-like n=1 Tax=Liolophura sinensis TaxID=3198878 RepID=UPI003159276A